MISHELGDNPMETLRLLCKERQQEIDARYMRSQWRLFWAFLIFMILAYGAHLLSLQLPSRPGPSLVEIRDLQPRGPTALCPGDTLGYAYSVVGNEWGVFDLDLTVRRLTPPPMTIVYSDEITDILVLPEERRQIEAWVIPTQVIDPLSLQIIRLTPGLYQRRIAISTSSRNTDPEIALLDFSIREDCF